MRRPARVNGVVGGRDVRRGRIGIREHGDRRDIELAARADDAERDFAAIGDEKTLDHQENGFEHKRTL